MKLAQIYEGWSNHLIPDADKIELINEVSEHRMSICNECEFVSTKHKSIRPDVHCTNCGCTLTAKTKCLTCECPLKKWVAITKEDSHEK